MKSKLKFIIPILILLLCVPLLWMGSGDRDSEAATMGIGCAKGGNLLDLEQFPSGYTEDECGSQPCWSETNSPTTGASPSPGFNPCGSGINNGDVVNANASSSLEVRSNFYPSVDQNTSYHRVYFYIDSHDIDADGDTINIIQIAGTAGSYGIRVAARMDAGLNEEFYVQVRNGSPGDTYYDFTYLDTQVRMEIYWSCADASGAYEVRVNGTTIASGTTTAACDPYLWDRTYIGAMTFGGGATAMDIDIDLYSVDASDWLGR